MAAWRRLQQLQQQRAAGAAAAAPDPDPTGSTPSGSGPEQPDGPPAASAGSSTPAGAASTAGTCGGQGSGAGAGQGAPSCSPTPPPTELLHMQHSAFSAPFCTWRHVGPDELPPLHDVLVGVLRVCWERHDDREPSRNVSCIEPRAHCMKLTRRVCTILARAGAWGAVAAAAGSASRELVPVQGRGWGDWRPSAAGAGARSQPWYLLPGARQALCCTGSVLRNVFQQETPSGRGA